MKKLILLLVMVSNPSAWAFPELVRHGYTHCTACHVAPTGGGVLTPYGRELSKEVLSTWGKDGEQAFLHGALGKRAKESNWHPGGDLRMIQIYRDNERFREAQWILMQADLEVAYQNGSMTLDAALGRMEKGSESRLGSRRMFLSYELSEKARLRIGKFFPAYGINLADHSRSIKRELGFDEDQESGNLELSWLGDTLGTYSTVSWALSEENSRATGRSLSFEQQINYAMGTSSRLGGSALIGRGKGEDAFLLGVHGMGYLGGGFYYLGEWDLRWKTENLGLQHERKHGWFRYFKLGYEVTQGWNLFLAHDGYDQDVSRSGYGKTAWGLGTQWYPRPHFEVQATWYKSKVDAIDTQFGDVATLLLHYYL